ncbi:N2-acetyl-L-ornithine:2-oxoglutarate 5-aminotransferase [Aureococcus anophagefferens]|nr:N2-acetyl-L-ornithine:2-oxoglutarate 5-aminotransferase [Aureococcus anophagefferens]
MPHGSEAVVEAAAAEKAVNELPLMRQPRRQPRRRRRPPRRRPRMRPPTPPRRSRTPPQPRPTPRRRRRRPSRRRQAAAGAPGGAGQRERKDGPRSGARPGAGRTIWIGAAHRSLKVCHEILGAALPDAVRGFSVTVHAMSSPAAIRNLHPSSPRPRARPAARIDTSLPRPSATTATSSFQLDLGACAALAPPAAADALTVASSTDYRVLGGAVANRLRANKVTSLRAIGKKAVWAAMRAVAVAREYTAADDRAATLAGTPRPLFFLGRRRGARRPSRRASARSSSRTARSPRRRSSSSARPSSRRPPMATGE